MVDDDRITSTGLPVTSCFCFCFFSSHLTFSRSAFRDRLPCRSTTTIKNNPVIAVHTGSDQREDVPVSHVV